MTRHGPMALGISCTDDFQSPFLKQPFLVRLEDNILKKASSSGKICFLYAIIRASSRPRHLRFNSNTDTGSHRGQIKGWANLFSVGQPIEQGK